jgi:hypothetical protein
MERYRKKHPEVIRAINKRYYEKMNITRKDITNAIAKISS